MSKVLDILEGFANMHGFTYLRLDGATKVEKRQIIVERFNRDPRIFLFLSTTRSGGFGINLTGADTVVFYDSDWNPAVDAQAQDRCHRIGQTKPVTIYRLITECTVEENILKKAKQKKTLNRMVIKDGSFTTDFLAGLDLSSLIKKPALRKEAENRSWINDGNGGDNEVENAGDVLESLAMKEDDQQLAQKEEAEEMAEDFGDESVPERSDSSLNVSNNDRSAMAMSADGDDDGMMADALNSVKNSGESGGFDEIESEMSSLQLYALRFLENVNPISEQDHIDAFRAQLDTKYGTKEKDWEFCNSNNGEDDEEDDEDDNNNKNNNNDDDD